MTEPIILDGETRAQLPKKEAGKPLRFQMVLPRTPEGDRAMVELVNATGKIVRNGSVEMPDSNQPLDVYFPGRLDPGRYALVARSEVGENAGVEVARNSFEIIEPSQYTNQNLSARAGRLRHAAAGAEKRSLMSPAPAQRYLYSGHTVGASAHFHRLDEVKNLNHVIPTLGASVLPVTGGLSKGHAAYYAYNVDHPRHRTLLSVSRVDSMAAGREFDDRYETEIEADIESIHVVEKLHIDAVKLHVLSTLTKGDMPSLPSPPSATLSKACASVT